MSFRAWLSLITLILIAVIIFFSRGQLLEAWRLLEQVNIWILLLLIPGQLLVYFVAGEMMFSYLRAKKSIDNVAPLDIARMSLEMNFVNHVLPSGGVSGVSYMGWRLKQFGISAGRATMAQVVRYTMSFVAFITLLSLSVIIVTIDGEINRWIILVSASLVTVTVVGLLAIMFLLGNHRRMRKFSSWVVWTGNTIVRKLTFGRRSRVLATAPIYNFFDELHHDYVSLRREKKVLRKPFLWGLVFVVAEVAMFMITFWALGSVVNPAPVLIAYGVASVAGFIVITPGGAGAYEAIMIAFLAIAGLDQGVAIAGILLTRVILLLGTIGLGYLFYQHAILKYGKNGKNQPTNL